MDEKNANSIVRRVQPRDTDLAQTAPNPCHTVKYSNKHTGAIPTAFARAKSNRAKLSRPPAGRQPVSRHVKVCRLPAFKMVGSAN
jgi:hypothetical protein